MDLTRLIPLFIDIGPQKSTPVRENALCTDILISGIGAI